MIKTTKSSSNYQNLTEKIAQEGGLQTDSKQFFDPIYQNWMYGDLLRNLNNSHKALLKIVGGLVLLIPLLLQLFLISVDTLNHQLSASQTMVNLIGAALLSALFFYIGVRILLSGIIDLKKKT